jgi:hypothetical protein
MITRRQLIVRHRALDPTAWTALSALIRLSSATVPRALARADLWEFSWPDDPALAERLGSWTRTANWFANPNRDRATWREASLDSTDLPMGAALASGGMGSSEPGAFLVSWWRGAERAPSHEAAARRSLGVRVEIRHGEVWWLAAAEGDAMKLLERAGDPVQGGLLVNPHSQAARCFAGPLPVPVLVEEVLEPTREGGRS